MKKDQIVGGISISKFLSLKIFSESFFLLPQPTRSETID